MKKLVILLAFCMIFFAGCKNEKKSEDKTLRIALSDDATSLDPDHFNDDYSENMMIQVYDTLVEKKPDGSLVNSLAKEIENPDPLTFKIKLRENVKFSNGDDLLPEDVIFSLTRAANSTKYSYIFGNIDLNTLKESDGYISFKLKNPDASFMEALSHPAASILSKKYVDSGKNLSKEPMGTGAFVLESWNDNSDATFVRNENYWGEKPEIKRIEMRVIPEASQRVVELESGGVDLAYKISPNDIEKIENNEDLNLFRILDNSTHFVAFNMAKPPFDNQDARDAIVSGVDMKSIFETVYLGSGKLATSPINPNFKFSIANDVKREEFNPEKAKELVKKSGLDKNPITIYTNDNQQRIDVATLMQAQLKDIGVDLKIQKLEWSAMIEALKNKEHNMFIMSWNPSVVDANYEVYQPFNSKNKGEGPNYMFYGNERVDALTSEAINTLNEEERAQKYKEIQEIINKEKPWNYICYGETLVGARKEVKGFEIAPKYAQSIKGVSFK